MNKTDIETVLRENIRALRRDLGWSQELLAEKVGVSAPYIAQIELGHRTPSLEIVQNIAIAFGVEYKTLFEENAEVEKIKSDKFIRKSLESKLISAVSKTIRNELNT